MTPAERQLVTELFDRLATLEDAPRDPDAERAIRDGLNQAPNAVYALVQTALVQDEALKQANDRIQELEAELTRGSEPPRQGGFLDNMRDSLWGRQDSPRQEQRSSVPRVSPGNAPMGVPPAFGGGGQPPMGGPGYGPGAGQMPPPPEPPGRGGGSFLGTAAAAAAGAIGGSMLLDGIRSMTGQKGGGHSLTDQANAAGRDSGGSPWGNSGGGGDLARQAGADDVGRSGSGPLGQRQGIADETGNRNNDDPFADAGGEDLDLDAEDFDDGDGDFGDDE
jgi:hypothetical protein